MLIHRRVDRLGDLTGSCADCVFWELGPALVARRGHEGEQPGPAREETLDLVLLEVAIQPLAERVRVEAL